MRVDDRELLNFSSNDYLGLATSPELKAAAAAATERLGTGSGASRLIYGGGPLHRQLETKVAEHLGQPAALSFANGYSAALGVLGALAGKGDTVILDKRCHASLIDGARLCGATIRVFPHNNLEKLERLLRSAREAGDPDSRIIVATESVFSMDGDSPPLAEIIRLKYEHGALLLLDEAHAFGIRGPDGRGLAAELGISDAVDLLMVTFGKAAGSAGGCVAGSAAWVDLVANRARSFIYSTAPPPAQLAASLAGLEIIGSEPGEALRAKLRSNVDALAKQLELPCPESAIFPVVLGDEQRALDAAETLLDAGFLVPAIRYPTVARGSARLRVTLSAAHRDDDIKELAKLLRATLA